MAIQIIIVAVAWLGFTCVLYETYKAKKSFEHTDELLKKYAEKKFAELEETDRKIEELKQKRKADNMDDKNYAIGVPAEFIQAITHPTMWDKIRQLPAEAFNEWLYAVVKNAIKTLGIDVEITDEMKAATLEQLMKPWEE